MDDTILFLPKDKDNSLNALPSHQIFDNISRLHINLNKSSLAGINVEQFLGQLSYVVGCSVLDCSLSKLEAPLGGNPCSTSFWDSVVRKFSQRSDNWKGAFFFVGWLGYSIQSSLPSVPLYYLSLFKIQDEVADNIKNHVRFFVEWFGW